MKGAGDVAAYLEQVWNLLAVVGLVLTVRWVLETADRRRRS